MDAVFSESLSETDYLKMGKLSFKEAPWGSLQFYRKQVRLTLLLDLGNGEDGIGHSGVR